ncbi:MAG: DNA-binding transcriptional regulator [Pirellulales bacterium]|nr:DNA-binding transcriptional regulator [Pirellulales bacterium]
MPKRVILLIESSRAYGRNCLLGVADYVRAHGGWQVLQVERGLGERLPAGLAAWRGDGVIARIESARMADEIARLRLPTVDLRGVVRPPHGATFDADHEAIARLAADHFLHRGFRHFAYCGFAGVDFSDKRDRAFRAALEGRAASLESYAAPRRARGQVTVLQSEAGGEFESARLAAWLRRLPKPVAVLACNDVRGRQVLEACSQGGVPAPEEAAVLGVDDDQVICELSSPPLSSIRPAAHRIGFEGAAMLDRLMAGGAPPAEVVLIAPQGLTQRQSSDVAAVDDPDVAAALAFIRDHAGGGLRVAELLQRVPVSRSTLERRFRAAVGRSPAAEIERVRMSRAQALLCDTDYGLERIARLTGYQCASQFAAAFKRCVKTTPGAFRKAQAVPRG